MNKIVIACLIVACLFQQYLLTKYRKDVKVAEQAVISCLNGEAVAETDNGMIISKGSFEVKVGKL